MPGKALCFGTLLSGPNQPCAWNQETNSLHKTLQCQRVTVGNTETGSSLPGCFSRKHISSFHVIAALYVSQSGTDWRMQESPYSPPVTVSSKPFCWSYCLLTLKLSSCHYFQHLTIPVSVSQTSKFMFLLLPHCCAGLSPFTTTPTADVPDDLGIKESGLGAQQPCNNSTARTQICSDSLDN